MRILLIKPKQIGDSLILTPTISAIHAAYPEAEIWVMVRQGCDGILAGCNGITRILTLAGVEKRDRRAGDLFRQIKVVLGLWSIRFDYVFELGDGHRARLFAILARTRRRYSVKPSSPLKWWERLFFTGISSFDWETCHRVEKDFYSVSEFLPLRQSIPPLQFAREKAQAWEPGVALTDFCVVQIGSRQGHNRWGREGWREVGRGLLERVPNIVISCGPVAHEREDAAWLHRELGPRAISTDGKLTWPEMAGLLYRAKLYVGPNTAAMHLAAACNCPVVALFGPSVEDHWHPWRATYRIVTRQRPPSKENTVERYARIRERTMAGIEAHDVIAACEELLL